MSKKLICFFLAVVLVLGLAFNGCGIFETNEERDYAQTVSTVKYGGLSATISKGELIESYLTYAETLMYYYGYTAEDVLEYCMNQLNSRKLLVLYAEKEYNIKPTVEGLGVDKYNEAIATANDNYQSNWESFIETIKEDRATASATASETPSASASATPTARPTPTPDPDEDPVEDDKWAKDNDGLVIPFYSIEDLIKADDEDKDVKNAALKKLWSALETNRKSKDYFVKVQLEQACIDALIEKIHDGAEEVTDDEISAEFTRLIQSQKTEFNTSELYSSALSDGENVYFVLKNADGTFGGYGFVKNLLVSFDSRAIANSEEVTALLAEYTRMSNAKTYSEDVLNEKLAEVASAVKIKNYGTIGYYDEDGLARDREGSEDENTFTQDFVLGNIEYDKTEKRFVPASGNDFAGTFYDFVKTTLGTMPAISDHDAAKARIKKFNGLIFGYGEDTGMFNNEVDYLVAPEGNNWYGDFTAASQDVIKYCETDETTFHYGYDKDISWSITPYGIHIILVTYVPVLRADGTDHYYALDTVVNEVTGKTVKDIIKEQLEAKKENAEELSFEKRVLTDNEENFEINKGVYDGILSK